jgi:hypothetical protein
MARLSSEDVQFFKDNGYLVKRGVLKPDLTERARNHLWENAPPQLDRHNPDTWVGPFTKENENEEGADLRRGYRWNFRRPGGDDWMIRLLATDPDVYGMAEELLGEGKLQEPKRIRGIYCTLPYGDTEERATGCHTDGHPIHLGVVGYIDDVPPRGGSFCVWPGSHKRFYPEFTSQYKHEPTDGYDAVRVKTNEEPPVDCYGNAGDIVFWHHRIGHMAGHNYSRQIRQAVLYDFRKIDLEETQEEPPCEDMWRDWEGVPS